MKRLIFPVLLAALCATAIAASAPRERTNFDAGWRFAFGHPSDAAKDFVHGTSYFSYLAKAGYGDGPADPKFDASAWRTLDLPHDWAVEAPFDAKGSHSHGYKAIGRNFPERSVGWYRKNFHVSASDLGRRIALEFDGVHRDSQVFVNGFYLGRQPSGSTSFRYDITDYLNYDGDNVVAVRVDVTLEEGWYYEGAGIYRHTWLTKTAPLHVAHWGTFVTTELDTENTSATVTARATLANEALAAAAGFEIEFALLAPDGRKIGAQSLRGLTLGAGESHEWLVTLPVAQPQLWSLETPQLHKLITIVRDASGTEVDRYETPFGIRSVRFDPDRGFFLNGQHVLLKGTNNHQDHAGVGVAVPDALWEFRLRRLKEMGSNAYRCSHHPPAPELLDACDRLGILVIDETRIMGANPEQLDVLAAMIRRDRNHPSVILWSVGNEEWRIEGNVLGARLTATMQAYARRLDPTRRTTVAISGGWGGSSTTADVVGYNYISQSNPDEQHAKFPHQPGVGTEETSTQGTRGIYFDHRELAHVAPLAKGDSGVNAEVGWNYYRTRPFLAGLFYWTGFDYRGEPTPFGFPAIGTQYGFMDTCGFPKDSFYYLQAWWTNQPVLHLFPHWNWPDRIGQTIKVGCHSNYEAVELFLNGVSLGKKDMPRHSHLEWEVIYQPGTLEARGYRGGAVVQTTRLETSGAAAKIVLTPDRTTLRTGSDAAEGGDVIVFSVSTIDAAGRHVPVAANHVKFSVSGGRILGVGNGDPSSHEADAASERSLFNGYAQVIVQVARGSTAITLRAESAGLAPTEATITAQ